MSAGTMMTGRSILRRSIMPTMLASFTAGTCLLMAAPQAALASAAVMPTPVASGPIVASHHTTKCVDDLGDSSKNDTPIVVSGCNGSAEQGWAVESDGTLQVNGKCMDIFRDEKFNKAPVELWTCTGGANQQWQAVNGTLVNPVSGKCLDVPRFNFTNGTKLEIYTCNHGQNQQWVLPTP
jgi:Ricin-type beta-trefoil lectin domain